MRFEEIAAKPQVAAYVAFMAHRAVVSENGEFGWPETREELELLMFRLDSAGPGYRCPRVSNRRGEKSSLR